MSTGTTLVSASAARASVTLWRSAAELVDATDPRRAGLGGWVPVGLDHLDPDSGAITTSDGWIDRLVGRIDRIAGTGTQEIFDETPESIGSPSLTRVNDLAYGPDGALYIAENGYDTRGVVAGRIRRRAPDGAWSLIAGTFGTAAGAPEGEGGPAVAARLTPFVRTLAFGPDGTLYFSDTDGLFHVEASGQLTRIAGRPGPDPLEPNPEGVDALAAYARDVVLLAVGRDGTVYFVRRGNNRTYPSVQAVMPDGRLQTIAGSVTAPVTGLDPPDGALAREVRLNRIDGLALAPDDTLYLSGGPNLWRVDRNGRLTALVRGDRRAPGDPETYAGKSAVGLPYLDVGPLAVAPDGAVVFLYLYGSGTAGTRWGRLSSNGVFQPIARVPAGFVGNVYGPNHGFALQPGGGLAWIHNGGTNGDLIHGFTVASASTPGCAFTAPDAEAGVSRCFDARGRLIGLDALLTGTRHLTYDYDALGRLASVTDVDGLVSRVERDGAGVPTAIVGPYGHRTGVELDARGWLSALVAPDGARTTFETNDQGLIEAKVDPRGHRSTYTYPGGALDVATDREGHAKTFAASGTSSVTVTTAEGVSYVYDSGGTASDHVAGVITRVGVSGPAPSATYASSALSAERRFADGTVARMSGAPDPVYGRDRPSLSLLEVVRPSGVRSTITGARTVSGAVTTDVLTVNGRRYETRWDAAARTLTSITPEGRTASLVLDARDRLADAYVPGFAPHHLDHDDEGRLRGLEVGGQSSRFDYDARSHLASITRFDGASTRFATDARGRITQENAASTATITTTPDLNGNLTTLGPPGVPPHVFTYDAEDRVVRVDLPDVGTGPTFARLDRDGDGRPHILTRPDGTSVTTEHDARGRPHVVYSGADARTWDYDDATDELIAVTGGGVTLAYAHDGPVLREIAVTGAVQGRIAYTHDADGLMDSRTIGGTRLIYGYDRDTLMTRAGPLTLGYSPRSGLPESMTAGAVVTTYSTHGDGELFAMTTSVAGARVYRVEVVRDAVGRVQQEIESIGGVSTTWIYDRTPDGYLERVTRDGVLEETAGYDPQGNRTRHEVMGRVSIETYDAQDRQRTSGDWSMTYRLNGEVETRTHNATGETWTHHYDALGALTGVTLPDGRTVTYVVDGLGRRVARAVDGVTTHRWLYGEAITPVAEVDATGAVLAQYVYAGPQHAPAAMIRGGRTYRFVTDVRGSVRLVVDAATGAVAQRLDYDRWGGVVADTNPGFQPFGYASGLWDADTGLVRFGARDYAPELNRWTSKDPLGFAAGDTSLYAYGLGDPITFVDPSGAVVPLIAAAIVAYKGVDFLWNAYDAYQTAELVMDPCVSVDEKLTEVALIAVGFAAGAVIGKSLRAMRRAKALSRIGCFAAGTLVVTATAAAVAMPIPIEEVKPGAAVAAYDAAQDAIVTARVVAVHERPGVATLALGLESEASGSTELVTTAEHPLWSWSAGGYSRADRIERGDWLFTRDAGWARVASVAYTGREETVYNLTVEGAESYFVGEAGVLAHNTPACSKILAENLEAAGHVRPPESAAHHIVAGNAKPADPAREVLQNFGIDINDAANGVFLPSGSNSLNPLGSAVHSTVHTTDYFAAVNDIMTSATTREEAIEFLGVIRESLLRGGR